MKISLSSPIFQQVYKRRMKIKHNLKFIFKTLANERKKIKEQRKLRKYRSVKSIPINIIDPNGRYVLDSPDPRKSYWYQYYIVSPQLTGNGNV